MSIEERVASDLKSAVSRIDGRPVGVEEIRRRASRRRRTQQGGWVAAALVLMAGVSVLATSLDPQPVDLAEAPTPSEILADNTVTTKEWEAAGSAVVACLSDRGLDAEFDPSDGSFTVASAAEDAFDECYTNHMGDAVQQRWSSQQYDPVADFEFYRDVVECTESATGVDFGDMTQTSLGYASSEARRTTNRAIEEAPNAYDACFDEVLQAPQRWSSQQYDPVTDFEFYRDVVECTESKTGVDFGDMTPTSLGYASPEARRTTNRAIEEAPDAYEACFDEILQSPDS